MTVGSTSPIAAVSQGSGVGNDRSADRPGGTIERKTEAEPFRRDDEKSRPAVVETQSQKRGDDKDKGRGAKVDFVV